MSASYICEARREDLVRSEQQFWKPISAPFFSATWCKLSRTDERAGEVIRSRKSFRFDFNYPFFSFPHFLAPITEVILLWRSLDLLTITLGVLVLVVTWSA